MKVDLKMNKVDTKVKVSDNLNVHELDTIQIKALWVIDHLTTSKKDRFTASEITSFLIEEGVNTSRQAVRLALIRNTKLCNKNKKGFKLMKLGKDKLQEQINVDKVIFIESGKPFSAKNLTLKDILTRGKGVVRICDPYVDISTLDTIFKNIDIKTTVAVLTSNVIDEPTGIFQRHLADLKQEGYSVEVRQYSNSELHDRYIMDDRSFWLSGNSLNHLGQKESFIVRLGEDIRQNMLEAFNRRWKISTPVTSPIP